MTSPTNIFLNKLFSIQITQNTVTYLIINTFITHKCQHKNKCYLTSNEKSVNYLKQSIEFVFSLSTLFIQKNIYSLLFKTLRIIVKIY